MERTSATAATQGQNIYSGVNNTNHTNNASSYPSSNSPNAVMYGGSSSNGGTPSSPSAAMYASPAHASSNQAIRQQPQQAQGTTQQNINQAQPSSSFNAYGGAAPAGTTGSGFFYPAPSAQAAGTQPVYAANPSAAAAVFPMRGAPTQPGPNQVLTPAVAAAAWTSAAANINAGSKLFVGQVPAVCTEDQLRPIFAQFGPLLEIKIMREPNGRSKGSAWVRFETEESAQRAINALNEKHVVPPQTNPLRVQFAAPSSNRMAPSSQSQSLTTIGSIMPPTGTAQQQPNYATAATYATPQGYPGATTAYMQGQYASPNLMAMRTAPQPTATQQQAGASGKLEYLRTNQPGGVIYSTAPPTGVAQAQQPRPQQQPSPQQQQQVVYAAGGQMRAGMMYSPEAFTMANQMTASPPQQQQQQQQHQWCT